MSQNNVSTKRFPKTIHFSPEILAAYQRWGAAESRKVSQEIEHMARQRLIAERIEASSSGDTEAIQMAEAGRQRLGSRRDPA